MYNPWEIEKKWQDFWAEHKTFKSFNPWDPEFDTSKKKFYALDMFPYPSWSGLHVGHPEWFTANDIVARYKKATGHNVLHPMWWDAFGLPAENYAIKTGKHPRDTTDENIATFKRQIQSLGLSYDWDREIDTTDPKYYKWTQWIFLKLFEAWLAYEQDLPINYCPSCKTWLANEEVLNDNSCERCSTQVVQKKLRQWVLAITKYADRLNDDVDDLDWPQGIKDMQKNWIGRNTWVKYTLNVKDTNMSLQTYSTHFEAFYADTFAVIAADHDLLPQLLEWIENKEEILMFAKNISDKKAWWFVEEKESEWIFTWRYLIDPITNLELPLWISSYALSNYGTWIIKCSAHDERDFNFAKKYNLPLRVVMYPENVSEEEKESIDNFEVCYNNFSNAILQFPHEFEWKKAHDVTEEIAEYLSVKWYAEPSTQYKLRDWLFSRQRYWWEPIPLIHLNMEDFDSLKTINDLNMAREDDKAYILDFAHFLSEEDEWKEQFLVINKEIFGRIYDWLNGKIVCDYNLPLELPSIDKFEPAGDGQSPLATLENFVNVELATNLNWERETNTMPQWGGSCWYYLRFMDPNNTEELVSSDNANYWGWVDSYVGWAEHAVLHLLYARFWHKFLYDQWLVSTKEPFEKLVNQWMILAYAYQDENGKLIATDEVEQKWNDYVQIETWKKVEQIVAKMSKSLKNVVNPDDIVKEYGADALRLYEMYICDFKDSAPWDTKNIVGVKRFLDKVWRAFMEQDTKKASDDNEAIKILNKTIKKVSEDIESYKFNTAIAQMMILVNYGRPSDDKMFLEWKEKFIIMLSAFAPHIWEELYSTLWKNESVFFADWPVFDKKLVVDDTIIIWVQVLWKVRWEIEVSKDESKEVVLKKAKSLESVKKWIDGKELIKEIYVPGRIVNLVVK